MSGDTVGPRVIRTLRETALGGSEREISIDEPLGEAGLGLDSLALVQFLVALEKEHKISLPMEFWSRADRASIRDCIDLLLASLGSD